MPKRKVEFFNNEIYHITMRGVDGRPIFMDEEDRWHGVFGLYEFNTTEPVIIRRQRQLRRKFKKKAKIVQGPALAN